MTTENTKEGTERLECVCAFNDKKCIMQINQSSVVDSAEAPALTSSLFFMSSVNFLGKTDMFFLPEQCFSWGVAKRAGTTIGGCYVVTIYIALPSFQISLLSTCCCG